MPSPSKLIFLPGAIGKPEFWQPVSDLLAHPATRRLFGWPGFGAMPHDPTVKGIDDLVERVLVELDRPSALIAQSMGGVIAMQVALKRPDLVTHLVLTATSGGVDMSDLQARDWRPEFVKANPSLPRWFVDYKIDLTARLHAVAIPTLLLWGDADPISPVSVGERLQALLPRARMHIIAGGEHDLANKFGSRVAPLVDEHLSNGGWNRR